MSYRRRALAGRAILIAVATVVAGCVSKQGASAEAEKDRSNRAGGVALTQLASAPSVRRVWSGPEVDDDARPSPDGRFFSLTDWSTGDLALHDLATGGTRRITNKGTWATSSEFAQTSIISPDGKSVAYGWYTEKNPWELRIAELTGADSGRVRTVFSSAAEEAGGAQSWTPDGKEILVAVSRGAATNVIAAIRASGSGMRVIGTLGRRYPNNVVASPDGRWIAYDIPAEDGRRNVHVIGMHGGHANVISRSGGDDVVMGWAASDGRLLIASERNGTPSISSVTIVNGKAVGEPLLVRSNMWRTVPVGALRDGRIFYGVATGERDVLSVAIDPVTAAVVSTGTSVSGGNQNVGAQAFGWSADGDHLAYVVLRGGRMRMYGPADVIVRSVARGTVQRFVPKLSRILQVKWFHDGRSLLLVGADDEGNYGVFRMLLANSSLAPIFRFALGPAHPRDLTFSPDGKRIFFVNQDRSDLRVQELDVDLGTASVLHRIIDARWPHGLAVSPDGKTMAIAVMKNEPGESRLILAPTGAGPARQIYALPSTEDFTIAGLAWTLDGRNLIFGVRSSTTPNAPADIRRLSLVDGTVSSIGLRGLNIRAMSISPDGRTLLYGVDRISMEMWTMEPPVFRLGATPRAQPSAGP